MHIASNGPEWLRRPAELAREPLECHLWTCHSNDLRATKTAVWTVGVSDFDW